MHVGVFNGIASTARRAPSIHHQGSPRAEWQRPPFNTLHRIEASREVKWRFAGPDARNDLPPFVALHVSIIVFVLLIAKHLELILVPTADDVQSESAAADLVYSGELFGCD